MGLIIPFKQHLWRILWTFLLVFNRVDCRSLGQEKPYDVNNLQAPVEYLVKYGYLNTGFNIKNFGEDELEQLKSAVKSFQNEAQLPVSGDLDEMTREVMSLPRCGNKETNNQHRNKRFATFGTKLANKNVTYNIGANNYTRDLPREVIDDIFRKATGYWAEAADLTFTRSEDAVIRLAFSEGLHNDGEENSFDGKGTTLAHGFFPGKDSVPLASDVHFDDAEDWTYQKEHGIALVQVATHEIGHALGMQHSSVRDAVMSAFYPGPLADFKLHTDDIEGIQTLYGSKPDPRSKYHQVNSLSSCALNFCQCGQLTAITKTTEEDTFFAFYGNYIYKLTSNRVAYGYPRQTDSLFPGFFGQVDAAYTLFYEGYKAKIYLFQDIFAYVYDLDSRGEASYIKHDYTENVVYGASGKVTAVVEYIRNEHIYLFTGESYYRLLQSGSDLYAAWNYPQSTSSWQFPHSQSPHAGLRTKNGKIYFFFGNDFYQYDDKNTKIIYPPNDVKRFWFGCTYSRFVQSENLVQGNNHEVSALTVQNSPDTYSYEDATSESISREFNTYLICAMILMKLSMH